MLTKEKISEIASRIADLPQFREGHAVIFGSVAWGTHSWRSDIDIACFAASPNLESSMTGPLIEMFGQKEGSLVYPSLVQLLNGEHSENAYALAEISPSTRDHFRQLARAKRWPYTLFLKDLMTIPGRKRIEDILQYAIKIEDLWASYQYYARNASKETYYWSNFETLGSIEHFPHHLMRKILGHKKLLPYPDTAANVMEVFAGLGNEMAKLQELFGPFYAIDSAYEKLVAEISQNPAEWSAQRYCEQLLKLFEGLPVTGIVGVLRQTYSR